MDAQSTSPLAPSLTLPCGATIPSRILKSAMSEGLGTRDHAPKEDLIRVYETWGNGGKALLVTGNIMVDRRHLGEPGNVVVEDDRDLALLKEWAAKAQKNGCHLWAQLNHPGKQTPGFLTKEPVSPSAIPMSIPGFNKPRALSHEEILEVIDRFANSALVLKNAGFKGVQIHGAHGYLVAQFLSPKHNKRDDQWGGSLENRSRFVTEIYKSIRAKVGPTFPIGIKLNSSDFQDGGFSEEESLIIVKKLAELGIDLIEVSGGNYEAPSMMTGKSKAPSDQAYFVDFAAKAKSIISTPIAVTGGFRTVAVMEESIRSSKTDIIGVARPYVLHPTLAHQAIHRLVQEFPVPYRLTTGVRAVDKAIMIGLTWYTRQIHILGKGKVPSFTLHPLVAAMGLMLQSGWQNFRRTRA